MNKKNWHNSMRGWFSGCLHQHMKNNPNIWLITGDLGFGMFDKIRDDFPNRFLNGGAAEQACCGIAVGLAKEGKIPIYYSITTFLLYRSFETVRNYINYESIPVKLIGGGRDKDYANDGQSHWALEAEYILGVFPNINKRWPETKEEMPQVVKEMIETKKPYFISLRR